MQTIESGWTLLPTLTKGGESGLDAEVDRVVSEMRGVRAEQDALHE